MIIDIIQTDTIQAKKQFAYYGNGINRNLFDFEEIRLVHRINSLNGKDLYTIEFYLDKNSTDYAVSLITPESQKEFNYIKNIINSNI